jgi:hypothetical protein
MEEAVFDDPVWQFGSPENLRLGEKLEDDVLLSIFYSDAIRRLQAVEQLTLPPEYTTIPNTGAFSRFEHIWGSVLFVRQMAAQQGIEGQEAMRLAGSSGAYLQVHAAVFRSGIVLQSYRQRQVQTAGEC